MLNKLDYYEAQSQQLLGRLPAQVWLMHANALNAATFEDLVAATQRRGYRFISLEQALQDPAYQHADGYNGDSGISWTHRWAMADHVPRTFHAGEPVVPRWVQALAGVDAD